MKEKAAYLKGLIDGLGIDENTKEGKVIKAMSELLSEMAETVDSIDEDVTHAYDQINDLSEELEDLEADLYEDEDAEDEEDDSDDSDDETDAAGGAGHFVLHGAVVLSGLVVLGVFQSHLKSHLAAGADGLTGVQVVLAHVDGLAAGRAGHLIIRLTGHVGVVVIVV